MKKILTIACVAMLTAACTGGDNVYDTSGIFEATEVIISAKGQGEILSIAADEGDVVKLGDTIAIIDTRQLALHKDQLAYTQEQVENTYNQVMHAQQQAELTQSATDDRRLDVQTQLSTLQQQRENLLHERDRFQQLLAKNAATQKQVDDIDYQIKNIDMQIAATREQLSKSNAALSHQSQAAAAGSQAVMSQGASVKSQSKAIGSQIEQVALQIADGLVTAPRTGTILQRYCEAGELAAPGKPLFKIADLTVMTLRAYITAEQYNTLKVGQKVQVSVDGNDKPYEGTVAWIASKAEFTPKTIQTKDERANLVYAIKIKVKNDGKIKIGMYGDCSFNP